MSDESPAARFARDVTKATDEHLAARHPQQVTDNRAGDAVDAVVRAVAGEGAAAGLTTSRAEYLAVDWPELAGALAALLHAEGVDAPASWLSMDVRRWSP